MITMDETFSIWIIPSKEIKEQFSKIINQLNQKFNSHTFVPHITLLPVLEGDIGEIKLKIKELVKDVKPFDVKLGELDYTDTFWKSLFVKVISNEQLNSLFEKFYESFKPMVVEGSKEYMPHLSIIYGNLPEKTKLDIINNLSSQNLKQEFALNEIFLISMKSMDPKDWQVIDNFKFIA